MKYIKTTCFLLLFLTLCNCTTHKKNEILWNAEWTVVQQEAMKSNQNFCIVLCDTNNLTSKLYLDRLVENNDIKGIFNIIDVRLAKNKWYQQWLYSNSAPITCIYTPQGKLFDIIPGSSHKCFKCIKHSTESGRMTEDLAYYNNFSIEKKQAISLLNQTLRYKFNIENGDNIATITPDSLSYPYLIFLELENSIAIHNDSAATILAKKLLSFNKDLDLEIYYPLFNKAKSIINPHYNPAIEPNLEVDSIYYLKECTKGMAKRFDITIKNIGEKPLKIIEIQTDCSCVSLKDTTSFTIQPKESQSIPFEFKANSEGELVRNIAFKTNGIQPIKHTKIIATCHL